MKLELINFFHFINYVGNQDCLNICVINARELFDQRFPGFMEWNICDMEGILYCLLAAIGKKVLPWSTNVKRELFCDTDQRTKH